jgi:hypothetical protein
MNQFHDTPITDRATGHTFLHRSYCASPEEAAAYARLTFSNPAVYAVGQNLSCAPRESRPDHFIVVPDAPPIGKTACADWLMGIHNLDTQPDVVRVQTELF